MESQREIEKKLSQEEFKQKLASGEKDFSHCHFKNLDFNGLELEGCTFEGSKFETCNFNDVYASNVNFSSHFYDVSFEETNLNYGFFENAQFSDVIIEEPIKGGDSVLVITESSNNQLNKILGREKGEIKYSTDLNPTAGAPTIAPVRPKHMGSQVFQDENGKLKSQPRVPVEQWNELQRLQYIVDTDILLYGKVSDETIEVFKENGYGVDTESLVKMLEVGKTPEPINKLSSSVVEKIKALEKSGFPLRICPNGQVYMDPKHLESFKNEELEELGKYYTKNIEFVRDPKVTSLPDTLKGKIQLMEKEGKGTLNIAPDGKVTLPLLELRYFTNKDISALNSYYMNLSATDKVSGESEAAVKPPQSFSEKTALKLVRMKAEGHPIRVCPNGQVSIEPQYLKFFKREELLEINQYYKIKTANQFIKDPLVTKIPPHLIEKLKNMEMKTGKKLVVTVNGKAVLPPAVLKNFSDEEISTLNSYYMNQREGKNRAGEKVKRLPAARSICQEL